MAQRFQRCDQESHKLAGFSRCGATPTISSPMQEPQGLKAQLNFREASTAALKALRHPKAFPSSAAIKNPINQPALAAAVPCLQSAVLHAGTSGAEAHLNFQKASTAALKALRHPKAFPSSAAIKNPINQPALAAAVPCLQSAVLHAGTSGAKAHLNFQKASIAALKALRHPKATRRFPAPRLTHRRRWAE